MGVRRTVVPMLAALAITPKPVQAHAPHHVTPGLPPERQVRLVRRNLTHADGVVAFCDHHRRWSRRHRHLCGWHRKAAAWQRKRLAVLRVDVTRRRVVRLVRGTLGVPYVWGGASRGGFDCSGLVQFVYRQVGVFLTRTTFTQFRQGHPVSRSSLRPGDVVFFYPTAAGPEHEGIYVGGGKFIAAPHPGAVVSVRNLASYGGAYAGGRCFVARCP